MFCGNRLPWTGAIERLPKSGRPLATKAPFIVIHFADTPEGCGHLCTDILVHGRERPWPALKRGSNSLGSPLIESISQTNGLPVASVQSQSRREGVSWGDPAHFPAAPRSSAPFLSSHACVKVRLGETSECREMNVRSNLSLRKIKSRPEIPI